MPSARRKRNGDEFIDLSLFGISDMELLGIIDDLADENGWATVTDIRLQLGEDIEAKGKSGVGPRLGWMRRYGWLERTDASDSRKREWRLTAIGQALLDNPKLSATFERTLNGLNPAQRLAVTKAIAEEAGAGVGEIRNALRRQWTRSFKQAR